MIAIYRIFPNTRFFPFSNRQILLDFIGQRFFIYTEKKWMYRILKNENHFGVFGIDEPISNPGNLGMAFIFIIFDD